MQPCGVHSTCDGATSSLCRSNNAATLHASLMSLRICCPGHGSNGSRTAPSAGRLCSRQRPGLQLLPQPTLSVQKLIRQSRRQALTQDQNFILSFVHVPHPVAGFLWDRCLHPDTSAVWRATHEEAGTAQYQVPASHCTVTQRFSARRRCHKLLRREPCTRRRRRGGCVTGGCGRACTMQGTSSTISRSALMDTVA